MTKIRCIVERITYQNPENGYTILKVRVKGYEDLVTVVGNLLDANVGSVLLIDGEYVPHEWKVDSRFGRQFMAHKWEETLPATVYGMEKYLGSGLIKGVGPKYAQKIVQKFGADTFTVIEENIMCQQAYPDDIRKLGAAEGSKEHHALSAEPGGEYRVCRQDLQAVRK